MKYLVGAIGALILLATAGLGVVWSGAYDVAATDPHNDIVAWAFETTMHNSVRSRAEDLPAPASFTEEQARNGFGAFDEMCVLCHGAPGVERTEWAKGMRPIPPPLAEEATRWNSAEIFWIVRHGLKMTGMPAMGPTHSDEDIWNIVAFVEQLPDMSPEDYARLREASGGLSGGGHHGDSGSGSESDKSDEAAADGEGAAQHPDAGDGAADHHDEAAEQPGTESRRPATEPPAPEN